uniref:Uncharacterized protein n=1 Tax=Percolomonas cosmopolitus TaxID=63605 RepID=A0A7S1PFU4_9EUKA
MSDVLHNPTSSAANELSKTLKPLHPSLVQHSSSPYSSSSTQHAAGSPFNLSLPNHSARHGGAVNESGGGGGSSGTPSQQLSPLGGISGAPGNAQSQFKKTISSINQQIHSQLQELQSDDSLQQHLLVKRGSKKNKQKISMMDSEKWMEYVRQLEDKNEMLEHRLEDLNHKFERYKSTAELRQETFIRREKRFQEKDHVLNLKLKDMVENHSQDGNEMNKLKSLKVQINDRIMVLQNDFESLLTKQKEAHKVEIEDTIRKFARDLELERKKNSVEEKDWQEKATAMKQSLEEAVSEAIKLDEQNEQLIKKNKELQIEYKAQKDDRSMILKNVAMVKRENQRLRDRIKQLEQDVEYHSTISTQLDQQLQDLKSNHQTYVNSSQSRRSVDQSAIMEREQRYEDTIARLKRLLDQERRNLKTVRKSQITLLAERSELEIFLRQCIDDVRTEIAQQNNMPTDAASSFSRDDRNRTIELLLSKEKVIQLLYGNMFGKFKPRMPPMHGAEDETLDPTFGDEEEYYDGEESGFGYR